ncbi:MAG: Transcriptional regulator, LysR family [Sphingomonas bacterium]|uniref:LysR substrate-binding domain-containing protein n=1 Tax=Sphingomonas bacterium TaxID=1895847 RepID=UPI0026356E1A|nr:LysR substrate-binding domain-containing protein [Sphingomonas bacterium]MDB5708941.1 Transcriptional regulator, LysR family [Sphingomonas bacterium]
MDLRHLRYFVAVAEEGSLTIAAEKRLHTAQPSLSRQMKDLEFELGCALMTRSVRGIELTAAGRVFLDHARVILLQVDAAGEAARRAAQPPRTAFALGFLTGHEFEWLAAVMAIVRDALPDAEVTIHSLSSPDLAAGLMRGKIDLALMRPERNTPGLVFTTLRREPLIVLMPADHRLTARDTIRPEDIAAERLVGVPMARSPALRTVIDAYASAIGIDLAPDFEVDNLSMAMSLVVSTGGIALMPLYARNLLPPTVTSRPLDGVAPGIDLAVAYNEASSVSGLRVMAERIAASDAA